MEWRTSFMAESLVVVAGERSSCTLRGGGSSTFLTCAFEGSTEPPRQLSVAAHLNAVREGKRIAQER
jgi:hypothetical protein